MAVAAATRVEPRPVWVSGVVSCRGLRGKLLTISFPACLLGLCARR